MFIPLVDSLRCPNAHDETWLVASIERAEERDIKEGMLGCPQCLAEYPIRDGIVYFSDLPRAPFLPPSDDEATRLAAALDLTDGRMTAVLQGVWGAQAPILSGIAPAQLVLLNPPEGIVSGDGISIVIAERAPLAASSVDGVAVDAAATVPMIAGLRASLRGGRRMLGAVALDVPGFLTELARDDDVWVAQLDAGAVTSAPVQLSGRRAPRTGHQ